MATTCSHPASLAPRAFRRPDPRQEPSALDAHAGICAGGRRQRRSLPRSIEDCRHVSRRLEQALLAAGERVVRVAPHRMGASRRGEREPGKSDEIDALAIARAVVKDGPESFPAAYLDEQAMEIR